MSDGTPVPSIVQGLKRGQSCWAEFLKQAPGIAFQQSTAIEVPYPLPADTVTRKRLLKDRKAGESGAQAVSRLHTLENMEAETLHTLKPFI